MPRVTLYLCDQDDKLVRTIARKELSATSLNASQVIAWAHILLRSGEKGCLLVNAGQGRIEAFRVVK